MKIISYYNTPFIVVDKTSKTIKMENKTGLVSYVPINSFSGDNPDVGDKVEICIDSDNEIKGWIVRKI